MNQYSVFALGNALVDTEIKVTDADLTALNLDKGLMSLIDKAQLVEIEHYLSKNRLVTAATRACGGSAANTLLALSHFGKATYLACRVADDELGHFYLDDLASAGAGHNDRQKLDGGDTGRCLVLVTPDAERTMTTYLGVSSQLCLDNVNTDALKNSDYLYIEGYLASSENSVPAAIHAREIAEERGIKIALTLSDPGIVTHFGDQLRAIAGIDAGKTVDILFCNEEEARRWCHCDNLTEAINKMPTFAKQFCITRGPKGAIIYDGFRIHNIQARDITAIDSNGAGDIFAGAFLYGLSSGWEHEKAGNFASLAAATVVSQYGPRLHPSGYQNLLKAFS